MNERIQHYRGSVAFGMTGYGPKPVFAPPGETGSGDGGDDGDNGSGDDNGGSGGDDAEGKGASGSDGKGNGDGSKLTGKGLFSKGKAGGDSGAGNGDGGDEADAGPKVADKFLNKDKSVNVDALAKAYTELEKAHGDLKRNKGPGGGEVPKTAEEYFSAGVKVPDEAPNFQGLEADDPGLKSWAEVCKKRGIGKDLATGLMSDMLIAMNDHAVPPLDPEEEFKSLGKNAQATVDGVFVWVSSLERTGELSEDDIGQIEQLSQTANGIRLLAKFRNMSGEKPIPVNPGGGVRGMSIEQLDEQYKAAVNKGDYAEQARLDDLRNKINPEGATA